MNPVKPFVPTAPALVGLLAALALTPSLSPAQDGTPPEPTQSVDRAENATSEGQDDVPVAESPTTPGAAEPATKAPDNASMNGPAPAAAPEAPEAPEEMSATDNDTAGDAEAAVTDNPGAMTSQEGPQAASDNGSEAGATVDPEALAQLQNELEARLDEVNTTTQESLETLQDRIAVVEGAYQQRLADFQQRIDRLMIGGGVGLLVLALLVAHLYWRQRGR
jgi:hypothetical protein